MKLLTIPLVLIAAAFLPARAHHEHAYGLIWKAGYPAPKQSSAIPADVWRYAFVSKYSWNGCQSTTAY